MRQLFDDYRAMPLEDRLKLKHKVRSSVMQLNEKGVAEKFVQVYEEAILKNSSFAGFESKFSLNLKKMLKRG